MKLVILVTLVAAALAGDTFKLTVKTKNVKYANSNGYFYATVIDYTGQEVNLGLMDNPKRNDFERGRTDVFTFHTDVTFKKIGCVMVRAGNKSADAWMFDTMSISSTNDSGFSWSNPHNVWISSDTSTTGDNGKLAMLWCAPPYPKLE